MSGRSLFTAAAAAEIIDDKKLGKIERPRRAVSLWAETTGETGRTEFITSADKDDDREFWPSLHAWPSDIAEALVQCARGWLAGNGGREIVATSCYVVHKHGGDTTQFVFILHHIAKGSSPSKDRVTAKERGEGGAPAPADMGCPLPAGPASHCNECGG